ncbi:hypothetical protein VNO77_03771 [Canavalia gladiata]|uniref:Protein kinase domain-containing protein n=1 Tax=Canavalia gladiata TaxID=3824 RepID=A0AAN9R750_CANGL
MRKEKLWGGLTELPRERQRRDSRYRHKGRDIANGKNRHLGPEDEDERKLTSDKVEPDDLAEDTLQLLEQEEEDLNRIKEESRRRREARMEKYKKQHQQVEQSIRKKGKDKDADVPTDVFEACDGKNDNIDNTEPSFAVGKSPENVNATSKKLSGAGGLGEGTPKSERSDDKCCDDIFEGYYSYRFGEILDGRYEVTAAHGKGAFSIVVRAKNLKKRKWRA